MILGFVLGMFFGASVGVIVSGLMAAASRADDESDAYLRRLQHTCSDRCRPVMERHFDEYGRRVS